MAVPSVAKRLFAVSGNLCAFPKCTVPLVDPSSGKVTDRVCHMAAAHPGGPRYQDQQSDEQRHGFDNLVLMCPIHHDVIDADEDGYPIERLLRFKVEREAAAAQVPAISDEQAEQLIATIYAPTVIGGSIIATEHQTGGQVAHTIYNTVAPASPQPLASLAALTTCLRRHCSENGSRLSASATGEQSCGSL